MGGTLYPEIRDLPGRMNHRMPPDGTIAEKFELRHDVTLTKGGVFHRIMGKDVVRTNTLHGQGIKEKGPRIVIDGHAPDGTPVLGASHLKNLYLNTGHGTLGWTMSAGSGKAVADLVLGRQPEIDFDGLTAARYGR